MPGVASLANGGGGGQRDGSQGHRGGQQATEEMRPLNGDGRGQNNAGGGRRDPSTDVETMLTTCIVEEEDGGTQNIQKVLQPVAPCHIYRVTGQDGKNLQLT